MSGTIASHARWLTPNGSLSHAHTSSGSSSSCSTVSSGRLFPPMSYCVIHPLAAAPLLPSNRTSSQPVGPGLLMVGCKEREERNKG